MQTARSKRERERQDLIQALKNSLWEEMANKGFNEESTERQRFNVVLVLVMVKYLVRATGEIFFEEGDRRARYLLSASPAFDGILKKIKSFARVPEEEHFIIGELVRWSMETFLGPIRGQLNSKEMSSPEEIFHAPTSGSDAPND